MPASHDHDHVQNTPVYIPGTSGFFSFLCIYSPSGSHSSNTLPSSAMRIDSNVSSKYCARSALSALGTGRSRVSGLRCAIKRNVVSSESCPTRLHEPLKLSDPSRGKFGLCCRQRIGLKSNHAPNARQKGVSFSRLRTRSASWTIRGLVALRHYTLHPKRLLVGKYERGYHSHDIMMDDRDDVPNENRQGDVKWMRVRKSGASR